MNCRFTRSCMLLGRTILCPILLGCVATVCLASEADKTADEGSEKAPCKDNEECTKAECPDAECPDEQQDTITVETTSGRGLLSLLGFYSSSDDEAADNDQNEDEFTPTHRQVAVLKVEPGRTDADAPESQPSDSPWQIKSFCLDDEGKLVVAAGGETGVLLLLSSEGERLQTISLEFVPEAVSIEPNGNILIGGEGKLARLGPDGTMLEQADSPLNSQIADRRADLREEVVASLEKSIHSMARMRSQLEQQIDRVYDQLGSKLPEADQDAYTLLRKQIRTASEESDPAGRESSDRQALQKQLDDMLRSKLEETSAERLLLMVDRYRQQIEQFEEHAPANGAGQHTEEQIEVALNGMIAYKSRIASISSANDEVFIATGSLQGYGYDVWRFDNNLENPVKIVESLRGCCGQMDVQACDQGVYVAENSRHRVCHFDREGNEVNHWGERGRTGVRGFGGCCNPMNLAFGSDGSVYTSESSTGRIKHYSADGKLLALIGQVDLVPGCKKVSIAVADDGRRIYMLDITRNHIVVMQRNGEDDRVAQDPQTTNPS